MLDTLPKNEFASLVQLAAYVCQAPTCFLVLTSGERYGIEAATGVADIQVEKCLAFSQYTLQQAVLVEMADILQNTAFAHHPLVPESPGIRSYFGIPLVNAQGLALGTLNILDTTPRALTPEQKQALTTVARQIAVQVELAKPKAAGASSPSHQWLQGISQASEQLLTFPGGTKAIESALASIGEAFSLCSIDVYKNSYVQKERTGVTKRFDWLSDEAKARLKEADAAAESPLASDLPTQDFGVTGGKNIQELMQDWLVEGNARLVIEGIEPQLLLPIFIRKQLWGCIRFTASEPSKKWNATEKDYLITFSNALTSAVAQSETEEYLKKVQQASAKRQYFVQSIIDNSPDCIYLKDSQSKFIQMNRFLLSKLGIEEASSVVSKTEADFFSAEYAQRAYDSDQQIIQTGVSLINFEEEITWPDGSTMWLSTTKMALKDEDGSIAGIFGVSRDITASKVAEIELINSRNYLNHIFDTVPVPIFVKDSEHRWIFLNEAWSQFSKVDKKEYIGKTDYDLHSQQEAEVFRKGDEIVFQTGKTIINEESITNQDGVARTVITKKTRFRDQYGKDFLVGTMTDITAIKNSQNQLLTYQNFLNNILNAVADPIFVKDRKHRIITVNDAFCQAAGKNREDVLHKSDDAFYSPKKATLYAQQDETVFTNKQAVVVEDTFIGLNQTQKTTITKKTYFSTELNEEFLVGSVTDITDLKNTEQAIVAKEKYYRSLILNSTDIISVLDKNSITRYHSPSFYHILGYSASETPIGESIFNYIHPEDVEKVIATFHHIRQKPGASMVVEHRFRKANGEWVVLESVGTNQLDDEAVAGIVVNSRDVTDRKKVEAEIRDKSQLLHGIISNMPVVVFKTNQEGIFTESIGAGLKRLDLTQNEVVGLNIYEVYPQLKEEIDTVFTKEFISFIASSTNEKEWYFETYIFADKMSPGGLIGFALDVTNSKISEQKYQDYALDLEKINKELDQFAYIISHDLKAPLRAIANLSQWIEDDLGPGISEDVTTNMKLLRSRVDRMQALIKGVLDYSRVNRTKVTQEEVSVDTLLNDILPMLEIPETHPVIRETPLPMVITNRTRLEQVFSNLISNAIKYHDKPNGSVRISYRETTKFHQFAVADDGPGIDPSYHEKIFVIFQTLQARDKVESTGVGLAIVKKIIEDQGGKIWIDSQVGQGATFYFTLPKYTKNLN